MNRINQIFQEVLKEIIPSSYEIQVVNEMVENLKKLLIAKAREVNITYSSIEPQGSTGIKQTQLKNDFDIDLFIGLDYSSFKPRYEGLTKNKLKKESKKDFLKLCNSWILKALTLREISNKKLLYAEHPYVSFEYHYKNLKVKVDIVLYFELDLDYIMKSGPITAVDRSPWHGRYVRDHLSSDQKNDVRLLKQFFIANHCYGDKCAVGKIGFIGYSAELLIYHFDSLLNLFQHFDSLRTAPLDPFNRDLKTLRKVNHFQNDALLIIDPIDSNRNVASAISIRAYKYCNSRIKQFLKEPLKNYFMTQDIEPDDLRNVPNYFIMEFSNINEDIHYTILRDKLYSLGESIKANAEKEFSHAERFGQVEYEVYFDEAIQEYNLAIYCEHPKISSMFMRKGPPIDESQHVKKFKAKNPHFFEKEGYLWVETTRDFSDFLSFLIVFIKSKIPEGLITTNISRAVDSKSLSAKRTITVLKTMVMPYISA